MKSASQTIEIFMPGGFSNCILKQAVRGAVVGLSLGWLSLIDEAENLHVDNK